MTLIRSAGIRAKLRASAKAIGKASLGFNPIEIGTHSLHSGAAMAFLFLAHVSAALTIMIIGHWRSDAFLLYIRKQVTQFPVDLSSRMLEHAKFFTIPDFDRSDGRASDNAITIALHVPDNVMETNGLLRALGNWNPVQIGAR